MVSAKGKEKATDDGGKGKRKRAGPAGRGGGDDDKRGERRKSRNGGALFIDEVADIFDDECEEDLSSADLSGYDSEMFGDEFCIGKAFHIPFVKEEEMSEEEFIRIAEARFKAGSGFTTYAEDGSNQNNSIDREIYVPSAEDPTIWKVECMVGQERYSALCLMQKYVDVTSLGNKLQMISACALDHVKGFIFMEAEKQSEIYEACKGLSTIYSSKVTAVPSNEIAQLLSIRSMSTAMAENFLATSPPPTKTEAVEGPDQKAGNFWTRIANQCNSRSPINTIERAGQQLRMHWSRVQPLIDGIYKKLEKDIQMAHEEYFSIKRYTPKFAPVDSSPGEGAERSHSYLSERGRRIGQKASERKGKKKASDADEENDELGMATKVMEEVSNAMSMKTAYDITLRDTSELTPEQLAIHNQWMHLIKRKFGM